MGILGAKEDGAGHSKDFMFGTKLTVRAAFSTFCGDTVTSHLAGWELHTPRR